MPANLEAVLDKMAARQLGRNAAHALVIGVYKDGYSCAKSIEHEGGYGAWVHR